MRVRSGSVLIDDDRHHYQFIDAIGGQSAQVSALHYRFTAHGGCDRSINVVIDDLNGVHPWSVSEDPACQSLSGGNSHTGFPSQKRPWLRIHQPDDMPVIAAQIASQYAKVVGF